MFTPGRIAFVIVFVLVFVAGLIWSYRKDRAVSKLHFKNSYKILLGLLGLLIVQFLIVKIRHFLA